MSSKKASKAKTTSAKKKKKTTGASKTGKRVSAKKTASASGKKKKTTRKKDTIRKATARKASPRKKSKSARNRAKKTAAEETTAASVSAASNEDSKSLSWMSARANSALKAVKASQAEKGQAVLAKTRQQKTRTLIDDESLIKIAASMPVEDEALIQFTAEDHTASSTPQSASAMTANTSLEEATDSVDPDQSKTAAANETEENDVTPETVIESSDEDTDAKVIPDAASPEPEATTTTQATYLPPPPAPRVSPWPARIGVLMIAMVLGFLFWPESNDRSLTEIVIETFHRPDKVEAQIDARQNDIVENNFNTATDITAIAAPSESIETSAGSTEESSQSSVVTTEASTPWQPSFIPQTVETNPPADTAVVTDTTPATETAAATHLPATIPSPPVAPAAAYGRPGYGYYPPAPQQRPGYRPYYPR